MISKQNTRLFSYYKLVIFGRSNLTMPYWKCTAKQKSKYWIIYNIKKKINKSNFHYFHSVSFTLLYSFSSVNEPTLSSAARGISVSGLQCRESSESQEARDTLAESPGRENENKPRKVHNDSLRPVPWPVDLCCDKWWKNKQSQNLCYGCGWVTVCMYVFVFRYFTLIPKISLPLFLFSFLFRPLPSSFTSSVYI